MATMYLICGVPASAKANLVYEAGRAPCTSVVSLEGIRRELFPGEPFRRGQIGPMHRLFHERMVGVMERGNDLVVDDVSRRRTDRERHIRRAKRYKYRTVCIFCDTELVTAIMDHRRKPPDIQSKADEYYIRNAFHCFEEPDMAEGWDEVYINREQRGERSGRL